MLSWIVRGKKRSTKSIHEFRKKLFTSDLEIYESIENRIKSKIAAIFVNEDILEEYSVKIYEIYLYFGEHYKRKYKLIVMVSNIYCLELMFF